MKKNNKKRRRKLTSRDKLNAVFASALLIFASSIAVLTVKYLHSAYDTLVAAEIEAEDAVLEPELSASPSPPPAAALPGLSPEHTEHVPPVVPVLPAVRTPPAQPLAPVQPPPQQQIQPQRQPPPPAAPPPQQQPPVQRQAPSPPAAPPVAATPAQPAARAPARQAPVERPPVPHRGTLVFVIDDAGHNLRDLEPFLAFPGPLTIAVLPGLPYSAEAARRIRAAGKEVFLHQPMESIRGSNPGPGAIMAGMNCDEIRAIITRNLNEIGPVAGMNNHEGSRITMDPRAMETILTLSREKGLLFLDSRTTAQTAAPGVARRLGMTIAERDVFLDNYQARESIMGFLNTGLRRAEQNGRAIMIGHAWSPELAPLLTEMFHELKDRGFSFSSVSDLFNSSP